MRPTTPQSLLWLFAIALAMTSCQTGGQTIAQKNEEHRRSGDSMAELVGSPDGLTTHRAHANTSLRVLEASESAPVRRGMLWYRVTPSDDAIAIQMRLLAPPREVSLFLPGPWANQDDWSKHITIRGASSPDGPVPFTLQRALGRIDLTPGQAQWIELDYVVKLSARRGDHDRFAPQHFSGKGGVFAYAPTFLVLPSEHIAASLRDIPIEVNTPDDWNVLSTWNLKHSSGNKAKRRHVRGYLVEDVRALRDAYIAASPGIQINARERALKIAYEPSFKGDRKALEEVIVSIMRAYSARFGDPGDVSILVRTPPSSHRKLLWGTGRSNGFVLELSPDARADHDTSVLIAHEAFHLWNGHELVPSNQHDDETRWFKEGLTQYVALSTLHSLGRISERALLNEIARAATRYQRQVDARFPPPKRGHSHYPYDRGLLLAMSLDAAIREDTGWGEGLTDWLTTLLSHSRKHSSWTYGPEELGAALALVAGDRGAAMQFWSAHCKRDRKLDLEAHFNTLGLHWLDADGTRPAKLVPLAETRRGWRAMLTHN